MSLRSCLTHSAAVLAVVTPLLASSSPNLVHARTFGVDDTADAVDANPGDGVCATAGGVCALRAAVMEANALRGRDLIKLPAGVFVLSIPPAPPATDDASTGDLDVIESITIRGEGPGSTVIDGGGLDRLFSLDEQFHPTNGKRLRVTAKFSRLRLTNGVTTQSGGGIRAWYSKVSLVDVSVDNNVASAGGGIDNLIGTLKIVGSRIADNVGNTGSGGILNRSGEDGRAVVMRSEVIGNEGGGIVSLPRSRLTVRGSRIHGNAASFIGGGIAATSASVKIESSEITNNQADHHGGGFAANMDPEVGLGQTLIKNSTISGNTSDADNDGAGTGGGVSGGGVLINTSVTGNTDTGGEGDDCMGAFELLGSTVIGDPNGCVPSGP